MLKTVCRLKHLIRFHMFQRNELLVLTMYHEQSLKKIYITSLQNYNKTNVNMAWILLTLLYTNTLFYSVSVCPIIL